MRSIIIAFVCVCIFVEIAISTQARTACTHHKALQAEYSIGCIRNWAMMYASYVLYSNCDDGAIAEEYDDKVVDLLTNHWAMFDELYDLSKVHPRFERFVLYHINTLMSQKQAMTIIENASKHCPPEAKGLCMKLKRKAQNPQ